jgi:hypothetical protein
MKNLQKGFVIPAIMAFIVFAVLGGTYFLWNRDLVMPENTGGAAMTTAGKETRTNVVVPGSARMLSTSTSLSTTTISSSSADGILAENFELLGRTSTITFGEALTIADFVASTTKIRPAFLLAISQEELSLEKTDLCYLTDLETGEGIRMSDGTIKPKTMNPTRDIPDFLIIVKALGRDPLKTPVTCPMSFGWGGAMGPTDFIPSTWTSYESRVEKITGMPADPWDIKDAFLAAGLFLSDSGASSMTHDGEWNAAMIYFSGSADSGYNFYADGALTIENGITKEIEAVREAKNGSL